MIVETVCRGSRLAYGSWKTIWRLRRCLRIALRERPMSSSPRNTISPDVGSISRRMQRPTVDLPDPDSPTSPSVPPARSVNDTSETACTSATVCR